MNSLQNALAEAHFPLPAQLISSRRGGGLLSIPSLELGQPSAKAGGGEGVSAQELPSHRFSPACRAIHGGSFVALGPLVASFLLLNPAGGLCPVALGGGPLSTPVAWPV